MLEHTYMGIGVLPKLIFKIIYVIGYLVELIVKPKQYGEKMFEI
jgi:hypothetical protein